MISEARIAEELEARFGNVSRIRPGVFKADEKHDGRTFAVRYFDLKSSLADVARGIREYQEDLLSESYFAAGSPTDLRWNHYLYLLVEEDAATKPDFATFKCRVEGDRTYARKSVVTPRELKAILSAEEEVRAPLPLDVERRWVERLDTLGLAYILDESLSAPEAARLIKEGKRQSLRRPAAAVEVSAAEKIAGRAFLSSVELSKFRAYPSQKNFDFGDVNLIVGRNGSGKTSLLEAIEFLYCGDNKRQADGSTSKKVTGKFGTGVTLTTSSSTGLPELRARNSLWYAKADVKKVTLYDSFGKFNFLDTDAAVDLSNSNDSDDRLRRDLGRLLLGEEAEKLATKVSRVAEKVEIAIRDLDRASVDLRRRLGEAKVRAAAYANAPKESDAIFTGLAEALNQVRWRKLPTSKDEAGRLSEDIVACATAAQRLLQANLEGGLATAAGLLSARDALVEKISHVRRAREQYAVLQQELLALEHRESALQLRRGHLRNLRRFTESEFLAQSEKREELKSRLARAPSVPTEIEIETFLRRLPAQSQFASVGLSIEKEVNKSTERVQALRIKVKATASAIESLRAARQEVLSSAKNYLELALDQDHCPVCRTFFREGELLAAIARAEQDAGTLSLSAAQAELHAAEVALAANEEQAAIYRKVEAIYGPDAEATVELVLERARRLAREMRAEAVELRDLESKLAELATKGFTSEAYLSAKLGAELGDRDADADAIESIAAHVETDLASLANEKKQRADKMSALRNEVALITSTWAASADEDLRTRIQNMSSRASELGVLVGARAVLDGAIDAPGGVEPETVLALDAASALTSRLIAAIGSESVSDSNSRADVASITALEAQLVVNKGQAQGLLAAKRIFDELLAESRNGSFTDQVLLENAASIARIFEEIHAPNEFDVRVNDVGALEIRRNGGDLASLRQMSTGQRSAYALSLFLAMNKNLNFGPPLVLLDDPVAHVDDLNILSFLDYLRDLAVSGSRQIFFATADDKIAGLFRQKFRFLGQDRFRDIELRRDI